MPGRESSDFVKPTLTDFSCIVVICLELFALILLWTFDMWSGGVPKDVKNVKV